MSRRSSAEGDGAEAMETLRLSVRKDLFPEPVASPPEASPTGVKLETDFEASIDNIALEKVTVQSKKRNHKMENDVKNRNSKHKKNKKRRSTPPEPSDSSDDEDNESLASTLAPVVSNCTVRLARTGGKPYSHQMGEISKKKWSAPQVSGKPRSMMMMTNSKKKAKKTVSATPPAAETYQSQIIDSANLRIKIKKSSVSNEPAPVPCKPVSSSSSSGGKKRVRSNKSSSKRRKATSNPPSASSGEEYEPSHAENSTASVFKQNHKTKTATTKTKADKKSPARSRSTKEIEIGPQGPWGAGVPLTVLTQIFQHVIATDGALPTLVRLGRVCRLWHKASLQSPLWKHIDLSPHTKEKMRTDYKLVWLLENRLNHTETLNLAHWGGDNIAWVVTSLIEFTPNLRELNLAGWDRLTPELLLDLASGLKSLSRLDLSHMPESGSCLSACSLSKVTAAIGDRLTHLVISNNHFSALNQILKDIATHCPNLEVLDLSGAKATSHPAPVPLDALQRGCTRLRVLRAANAQLVIPVSSNHPEGPGFPQLEELSAATEWGGTASLPVGDYRLEDEGLARILKGATRLKLLDLRGCRVSGSGLVRVPAWDLQHLFLAGCNITRQKSSCLELICEKWAHSLVEVDFSWATATVPLDAAVETLADKGESSNLKILNLCGSSVSFNPLKKVLLKCPKLETVNLSSCRALPRGMKRNYCGKELKQLIESLDPTRKKAEDGEETSNKGKKKCVEQKTEDKPNEDGDKLENQVPDEEKVEEDTKMSESPSSQTVADSAKNDSVQTTSYASPDSVLDSTKETNWTLNNFKNNLPKPVSSSSSPKVAPLVTQPQSESSNSNWALGNYSPMARVDQPVQSTLSSQASPLTRPEVQQKSPHPSQPSPYSSQPSPYASQPSPIAQITQQPNSPYSPLARPEGVAQPPYSSHASPLARPEAPQKSPYTRPEMSQPLSPYTSQPSPRTRPDTQTQPPHSPYPTHPSPYSAQPSPYSSQKSPYSSQRSPYSSQHSPFSTQQSPYSTQQSPYSAQPSPDTSQIVKMDVQKSWNVGGYSPATAKPYLNYPVQASPDSGPGARFSPATNLNDALSPRHISQYTNCQGMTNLSPNVRNDLVNIRNDGLVKSVIGMSDMNHDMSPDTSNNMLRFTEPRLKDNRHSVYPESSSVE